MQCWSREFCWPQIGTLIRWSENPGAGTAFPLPQVGLCSAMDMGQKACYSLLGALV